MNAIPTKQLIVELIQEAAQSMPTDAYEGKRGEYIVSLTGLLVSLELKEMEVASQRGVEGMDSTIAKHPSVSSMVHDFTYYGTDANGSEATSTAQTDWVDEWDYQQDDVPLAEGKTPIKKPYQSADAETGYKPAKKVSAPSQISPYETIPYIWGDGMTPDSRMSAW